MTANHWLGARALTFMRVALKTAVGLAVVSALVGQTAPVRAETLKQALAAAYKSNPQLDAERARLRATDEEVPRAKSGYRPSIIGNADAGWQATNSGPPSITDGRTRPHGYSVSLNQQLFRGFRTINTVREAEALVRAGRESLRLIEQQVLLSAVTAYVDVVRDQAIVRLRENNVKVLTRELRATNDRRAVGEVTKTDVAQARARRAGAVSAYDAARAALKASRARYQQFIGHIPRRVHDAFPITRLEPRSQPVAVQIGLTENPNIVASLYREQAARHAVDRILGEKLPSLSVEALYARRFQTSRLTDRSESASVVGRLTVPFYQGGEVDARVRQAKHTHVSRLQEVKQARTETKSTIITSWSQLIAARAQLQSDRSQVQANQIALTGVREEERFGQRTLLDVLNAEQELLNAQVSLVGTKRDLVVASYTLVAAIGRLNAVELGLTGKVYDARVHYQKVRKKWRGISITHSDGRLEELDTLVRGKRPPLK